MNATNPSFVGPNASAARDFIRHLVDLLRKEHGAMVNFLLALNECDGRRLWSDLGYASLFDFVHRELKLSRSAAYYRVAAAGLVSMYPEISDALADGQLCLTTLAEISKVITPANAADIVPRFFHLSSREAKEVVAELAPHPVPPRRDVVTPIRPTVSRIESSTASRQGNDPSQSAVQAHGPIEVRQVNFGVASSTARIETALAAPTESASLHGGERVPADEVQPLTATLRRIHFTVSKRWMEKLNDAKAAVSHRIPSGSAEEVLEAALDALLAREAKRRALVKNPREPRPDKCATEEVNVLREVTESLGESDSVSVTMGPKAAGTQADSPKRHRKAVPAHVLRDVMRRDEGRCQAKLHDGSICGSKVRIQFDHIVPDSLGGPATVANGRILGQRHNDLAARRVFGEQVMDLFGRRRT